MEFSVNCPISTALFLTSPKNQNSFLKSIEIMIIILFILNWRLGSDGGLRAPIEIRSPKTFRSPQILLRSRSPRHLGSPRKLWIYQVPPTKEGPPKIIKISQPSGNISIILPVAPGFALFSLCYASLSIASLSDVWHGVIRMHSMRIPPQAMLIRGCAYSSEFLLCIFRLRRQGSEDDTWNVDWWYVCV